MSEPMDIGQDPELAACFSKLGNVKKTKLSLREVAAYTGKSTEHIFTDVKIVSGPAKV